MITEHKRVLNNLKKVIKNRNIELLSKASYNFVRCLSGFIAHYNINGFKNYYSNFDLFLKDLKNSSDLKNPDYYLSEWFMKDDKVYYSSKAELLKELRKILNEN